MKRTELLRLVEQASRDAIMTKAAQDKLLEAVSDPSVTRVAAGCWHYAIKGSECFCPAALAFGMRAENEETTRRFAASFDVLAGVGTGDSAFSKIAVVEIED